MSDQSQIIAKNMISIAIPTYNQSFFLNLFFLKHIDLIKNFKIQIIVSDNASTDNTEEIVKNWQNESNLISYYRNSHNIGYDKNVLKAFGYSKSKYTWLMGDTYYISSELFKHVLITIEGNDFDFLVINLENKIKNIPSRTYSNKNKILSQLGGVMSCLSCLIYNQKMINSDLSNLNLFSRFIHLEIIFKYIINRSFNAAWISDESVKALKHNKVTKKNWSHKEDVFDVGFKKWVDFIYSLPDSYLIDEKNKCISSFGKLSNLGTFRGFIMMRARGHFTYSNYKKYKFEINLIRTIPSTIVIIILIIPTNLLGFFLKFYTKNHLKNNDA